MTPTAGTIRVFHHPATLEHDAGSGHPESPERIRAILRTLREGPLACRLAVEDAPAADRDALERVHPATYLDALQRLVQQGGGRLDEDTVASPGSWDAALRAAGGAVAAMRSAVAGVPAFAAVRPPGHHALADRAMGFCLINNVAVAAHAALAEGVARVLIVDWDVHHGNGTQAIVERDPRIRYVSLHQWPLYPGTGRADERGVGNIFNVPRPPGLPRAEYVAALDAAVQDATDGWLPELMLLSAGFDAMAGDPLAGFTLEPDDYAEWVTRWRALGVPIASVLEGGYAPTRIAVAVETHLAAL
ncbi:MAG: histone deacetylase [Gemmatimonadota bacterium]|nr:histone deacetylase [Gemmatimonadota bacterium]MDH5197565.1 histone deacetylase [Gemmatimonadota bacterium]